MTLKLTVQGTDGVKEALQGIKTGVQNRVVKRALRQISTGAAKVGKTHLKASGARRTGALRRSLGVVYKAYRASGTFVFLVGARSGFKTTDQAGNKVDPRYYAHLVEGGRKAVTVGPGKVLANKKAKIVFGKRVKAVGASPFMAPAYQHVKAGMSSGMLAGKIRQGIAIEAARYAGKGKSIYGALT